MTSVHRCWRSFDPDTFRAYLLTSALCDVQSYSDLDCDSLASHRMVIRPSPSWRSDRFLCGLWPADDARRPCGSTTNVALKRNVRRLERAARREGPRRWLLPRGALNVVRTSSRMGQFSHWEYQLLILSVIAASVLRSVLIWTSVWSGSLLSSSSVCTKN